MSKLNMTICFTDKGIICFTPGIPILTARHILQVYCGKTVPREEPVDAEIFQYGTHMAIAWLPAIEGEVWRRSAAYLFRPETPQGEGEGAITSVDIEGIVARQDWNAVHAVDEEDKARRAVIALAEGCRRLTQVSDEKLFSDEEGDGEIVSK